MQSTEGGRVIRRIVVLVPPLALGVLELAHPASAFDTSASWWTTLHLIQMPLFGLMAFAGFWLVSRDDVERWARPLVGVCMGIFVVYYTALDSVAGVALGRLLGYMQSLPSAQQAIVQHGIDRLYGWTGVLLFFQVGKWAWILGMFVAASALARAARPWPPVVLLALSGLPLRWDHARPYGPIAFGLFFIAALWLEFWPTRGPSFQSRSQPGDQAPVPEGQHL
jgi:hypothetical protein